MSAIMERHATDLELRDWFREHVLELEAIIREGAPPEDLRGPADFVLRHYFAPGQYAREIELPYGSCVIGRIHRHAHVNVISAGRVLVHTEDGIIEIVAPATFVSKAATKRVVLALEDTVWTTIHANPTDETDVEKIDAAIIAPTYAALEEATHVR